MRVLLRTLCVVALATVSSTAFAQATRTWVSGVGDDVNPCSRTAPCKTFAGAISKTAAGGTIDVLDPGGFGSVTITKAITIESRGELAGVLAAGTAGIVVSAASTDTIVLRGLTFEGVSGATQGVRVNSAAAVHIEECTIQGYSIGVDFEPTVPAQLLMRNDVVRNNASGGVLVAPGSGGTASGLLEDVTFERNLYGVRVQDDSTIDVKYSTASNNTNNGLLAVSTSFPANLVVEHSSITNNGVNGIAAVGTQANVTLVQNTIAYNNTGILISGGAMVTSCFDNRLFGNTTGGAGNNCPGGYNP